MDKITLSHIYQRVSVVEKSTPVQEKNGAKDARINDAPQSSKISENFTSEDKVSLSDVARKLSQLAVKDREVRNHEAAHASVGGRYAGAPMYKYEKGSDGRQYAVGGEVSIDTSPVAGDPHATLKKADIVRAAALAPSQPSQQDHIIANKATQMAMKARAELRKTGEDDVRDLSDEAGKNFGKSRAKDAQINNSHISFLV